MLASVNVGLPQPLATHKGDVRSGILKTPVAGRVRVRRLGLDGENLTVDGMLEGDVRIGDIYRIGSAVMQVTQPRSPCFTLAAHFRLPDLPKTFLASGRSGFYLRVLEEGDVGAGDAVELISSPPTGLTVLEASHR
jgi:MOSC domain-containing protein YiiM